MKKIIYASIGLLLCCDITLMFAAQAQNQNTSEQLLQQLRQLQQQSANGSTSQTATTATTPAPTAPTTRARPPFAQPQTSPSNIAPAAVNANRTTNVPPQTNQSSTNSASQVPTVSDEQLIDEAAFRAMSRNALPMSPEQIMRFRQLYNASKFATAATPGTPPRPTATSQFVSLAPGTTPPVIRLSQGFVTSLVFLDSTGAPWPIAAYDLGNPNAFNIQWDKTSNTLMVQATKLYTYGNLAIRLRGLNTPVMITLIPGQKAVDYRVDLRIQGLGPEAKPMPTGQGLPASASPLLLSILDGVPPPGSKQLTVDGGAAQVWLQGTKLFIRTRLTILSPSWLSTMASADGMRVYEMQKTPLLLVSQHGKVMQIKIEGL